MQGYINKKSGISFMGTFVYTVSLIDEKCLLHELYSFSNKFTIFNGTYGERSLK